MPQNNHYSVHVHDAVITIRQYMDDHPIKLKTCAQLWDVHKGSSRAMIEKAFKSITGYGIKEYMVLKRLDYSKRYLREGMPIKHIATRTLYKSQSAYCTAFKRYFNITPTNWLKNGH